MFSSYGKWQLTFQLVLYTGKHAKPAMPLYDLCISGGDQQSKFATASLILNTASIRRNWPSFSHEIYVAHEVCQSWIVHTEYLYYNGFFFFHFFLSCKSFWTIYYNSVCCGLMIGLEGCFSHFSRKFYSTVLLCVIMWNLNQKTDYWFSILVLVIDFQC